MDINYQPPLRGAVLKLIKEGLPIGEKMLADLAGVPVDRALAYLSILLRGKMLRRDAGGAYRTGPKWSAWADKACRSRPIRSMHSSLAEMDGMRRTLAANVTRLRTAKEWSCYRLAKESGVGLVSVLRLEEKCAPPPFGAVVMISRALGVSVESLLIPGGI